MSALLRRPAARQTPASPAVSPGDKSATTALARVSPQVAVRPWGMLITAALLFCIYLLSNSGRLHIVDEASLFAVTESLALRGQVDTNAIAWTQWVNSPGEVLGAFGPNGEVYSKKGPAPAFLAVPWFLALRAVTALDVQLGMLQGTMLWNGLVTALTAVLLWLTAIRLGYRERTGMALALLFGLATIAWPYARLFFGEPLSAFALLLCFSGILHWRKSGQWPWMLAAGAGAGLAVATVTAHAVLVGILGIYALVALWQRRSDGWRSLLLAAGCFALPLLLAGGLLLGYNAVRFGNPFDTGYHFDSGEGFTTPIWEGFWGLIFSPYRSVFLHTPLLIASLFAFVPFARRHRLEAATIGTLSVALVALYSMWWMWWGGYAWGPRFLVPLTPLWVLVLAPVVEGLINRFSTGGAPAQRSLASRAMDWLLIGTAALSFLVQMLAVSFNFVNWETRLRSEFFPTDWANPLAYGPPAQALGDLFLSPVFGQIRLVLNGGVAVNSDVSWLWPDGHIAWMLLWVGLSAVATLLWLLVRWWNDQDPAPLPAPGAGAPWNYVEGEAAQRLPSAPLVVLTLAIPLILTGAWLGAIGRDPLYGTPGTSYQAVLADLCTADRPGDAMINTTAFGYHIPMNWLAPYCGRALPVYGYALNSMDYPEAESVLSSVLEEHDRIFYVTAGVAPNAPENSVERWLATRAYKADDRWFDDHRLLRYATAGALDGVADTEQNLFLSEVDGANSVTIVGSRAPSEVEAGAIVPVEIRYQVSTTPTADLRWFVQLLAPSGVAVAQLDTGPDDNYTPFSALAPGATIVERAGLQLPADLAPGDYQLIAGVYNPAAPGAPRLRALDGREFLALSTLRVAE